MKPQDMLVTLWVTYTYGKYSLLLLLLLVLLCDYDTQDMNIN
jgi:hypothetical protein